MLLELHLIQNFAPANLNRDDTGAPKDCEFGLYRRARISSQCIKRAIRDHFGHEQLLAPEHLSTRTKRLCEELSRRFTQGGHAPGQADQVAETLVSLLFTLEKDRKTEYLLFLGAREIEALVAYGESNWATILEAAATAEPDKKASKKGKKEGGTPGLEAVKKLLDGGKAADLALFGRMIANYPDKNVDAACQVAQAISTHAIDMEFDYYTAVDDLRPGDNQGSDMIGNVQFNSACYYRYANVDVDQLVKNLDGDRELATQAVRAFVQASVEAVPTGKQNSMAAHNPPSLIYAVVRDRGCWNLANAFVRPVRAERGDVVVNSMEAMDRYWQQLTALYGGQALRSTALAVLDDVELPHLGQPLAGGVPALLDVVTGAFAAKGA